MKYLNVFNLSLYNMTETNFPILLKKTSYLSKSRYNIITQDKQQAIIEKNVKISNLIRNYFPIYFPRTYI